MSAPLRIRPPAGKAAGNNDGLKSYLDRLLKLIPAEVLSLYLVGVGVIPKDKIAALIIWAVFCLIAVGVVKAYGTSDRAHDIEADKVHVTLSMIAFVIWVYSMGGLFEYFHLYEAYVGSLLILAFTFAVPYFYRGQPDTAP
jgi:uncharacterized membrane protein YhaH (DUF805 family)